jgi:hypothetical protein
MQAIQFPTKKGYIARLIARIKRKPVYYYTSFWATENTTLFRFIKRTSSRMYWIVWAAIIFLVADLAVMIYCLYMVFTLQVNGL